MVTTGGGVRAVGEVVVEAVRETIVRVGGESANVQACELGRLERDGDGAQLLVELLGAACPSTMLLNSGTPASTPG